MNQCKGYYSIIQFCPEIARRESVNIGVVLFVPEKDFLQARLSADNDRVKQFFGTKVMDFGLLSDFKKSFQSRIESERGRIVSVDSFKKFIDTRGNQIQLTEPMFVKVRECPNSLDSLFEQLVGAEPKRRRKESLKDIIQKQFELGEISNLIETDVPVSLPILEREIKVPFGFQNCAFHLMQPVAFLQGKEEANFNRALKYSMEGRIIQEKPNEVYGSLKFDVIGSFSSDDDPSIPLVRKVLDESDVKLYLAHDLSSLVEEIRNTGKIREKTR